MRQNMRISNIIISFLLLMASPLHAISKDTYDFGTISQDTTLFWDGELPMYTPAITIYFKTTRRMYLTMELNGNIDCVQDMSQDLNLSVNNYRAENLHLPKGSYTSHGVVSYNILNKIPYVHAKLTFRGNKPESKPEDNVDYSSLQNAYPVKASNHIFVTEPTIAVQETSASSASNIVTKLFYDGFGRLVETVDVAASPNRKHVTTIRGYDYYGRKSESWKPAEDIWDDADEDGYIDPECVKDAAIISYKDSFPYSRVVYEHNPLERTCGTLGIGQEWRRNGKNETTEHLFNDEQLRCLKWEEQGGTFKNMGYYAPGTVYVTKDTDEDGNISYSFNNHDGKTILKRKLANGLSFDTYYIYDDAQNLRYILPPAFSEYPMTLDETDKDVMDYAYMYHYDDRRRCTKKKLPGCDWVCYIHDRADHVAFSQDGEMRKQGKWMFHLYDRQGRICLEGICANDLAPQDTPELDVTAEYTGDGMWGYDIQGTNLVAPTLLNAYYYDDYDVLGTSLLGNVADYYKDASIERLQGAYPAKGLLTAALYSVLGDEDENSEVLGTVYLYDEKGRNTQTVASNIMGGIDLTSTTYTFRGKACEKVTRHILRGKTTNETVRYGYDHAERIKDISYAIDNGAPVKIAAYTYDNVGRLAEEVLGENVPVKYAYNVRDWLDAISSQHFKQQLFFEKGTSVDTHAKNYYNGNISAMKWNTNGKEQAYTFTYDGLDRLLYADHMDLSTKEETYSTEYDYDKNGNVTYLTRMGLVGKTPDIKQELYFSYDGNQLIDVRDDAKKTTRKGDSTLGGVTSEEMILGRTYDKNGNVTMENDKGIQSIKYNALNLPCRITFKNGNSISYLYSSKGEKLRVTYRTSPMMVVPSFQTIAIKGTIKKRLYTSDTLSYCGNFIYRNDSLLRILNETGFAMPSNGTYALHYFIKDHLGNVRILADASGNVEQAIDYYPFGSLIAESQNAELQPYLYNGKELDRMNGLDWYDYGARMLESDGIRWGQVDPRAEDTPDVSPYVYCNNNPIRRLDHGGMFYGDYYDNNGQLLGNDGRNDKKVFVIRARNNTYFDSYKEEGEEIKVNGIKNKQRKAAIQELQEFNGDSSHDFTNVQNSFVELDGSQDIRQEALSYIKDDGKGGTSDNNNREYGMNFAIDNPLKVYDYIGAIAKSGENMVSVDMPISKNSIDIHTHPSGTIIPNLSPAPSAQDIINSNENSNSYVISMSNKTVYIYNKQGILTYFPLSIYTK